jgi:Fe-S cluster assembly protein SufD
MKDITDYCEAFQKMIQPAASREPAWLFNLRRAGLERLTASGFPTLQHEDWRFTNVAPIVKLPFRPVLAAAVGGVNQQTLDALPFGGLKTHRVVFINGHWAPSLTTVGPLPEGVRITSLAAALAGNAPLEAAGLGSLARMPDNGFEAVNTAFFQDGALIQVPDDVVIEQPIELIFLTTARESGATTHPRNLVVCGQRSRATILECHHSLVEGAYFTNAVTEFIIGDHADVEHIKYQDESTQAYHIASLHSRIGRAARFISHSFALGARLSRNNLRTCLNGEGLEVVLNGLYLTRGDQLADHHMVVEHAQPHCASHEYFNGILDDKSRGVFHGRILVRRIAQKTDAKQTNKNLLLSDDATANTKPQLEIYADDVKCTHGATVGQLNDESIFYLRSRGIGLANARRMLIHAFAGEIIDRVRCEAVREIIDRLVWDRLEQKLLVTAPV